MRERIDDAIDSVQRGPVAHDADARVVVRDYFTWLERTVPGLRVLFVDDTITLRLFLVPLVVMRTRSESMREVILDVIGGMVAHPTGTFTFTVDGGELVSALLGYRTRLPRALYLRTQLVVHEVMGERFVRRHAPARA